VATIEPRFEESRAAASARGWRRNNRRSSAIRAILFLVCISIFARQLLPPAVAAERNQFVNSPGELRDHFQLHIRRVTLLGVALYGEFFQSTPALSASLLRKYLAVHDQTKILDSSAFRTKFWRAAGVNQAGAPFVERLFGFYNSQSGLDETRESLRTLVTELNATDRQVGLDFFLKNGLLDSAGNPTPLAQTLLRIERIADVVDRNSDPVAMEEFGIAKQPPLAQFIQSDVDLAMATWLKERYARFTKGYAYTEFFAGPRQSNCNALRRHSLGAL
jgi:hypothetical protein